MIKRRRLAFLAAGTVFASAACGAGSDSATPDTTSAPAEPVAAEPEPAATPVDADTSEQSEAPVATEPNSASSDAVEETPTEPVDETAAEADPEPEVGPAPAELGGRSFGEAIEPAAQFDGNPFPDLVVDDVGRETKANLANVLPSDRPVLLWAWAPH